MDRKRVIRILFVVWLVAYIAHTSIEAYAVYSCRFCSYPWTVALYVMSFVYAFPLIIIVLVNFLWRRKEKKVNR